MGIDSREDTSQLNLVHVDRDHGALSTMNYLDLVQSDIL